MAARQKEMELAEKAMKGLFADIGAEITDIKTKVEEFTAEPAVAQPVPQREPVKFDFPGEKKGGGEQKSEIVESSAPQDAKWRKKCPMCGGRMDFYSNEEKWQCYACAYEELKTDEAQDKSEIVESSAPQDTELQKKCPMCGGRMDFYSNEEKWQCYACAYEELKKDEGQGKSEKKSEQTNEPEQPFAVPLASMSFNEKREPKKDPSPVKKKPCPVCHKKMNWHPMENTWRCPHCDYERRI
jgi:ribosomal protein S27AE